MKLTNDNLKEIVGWSVTGLLGGVVYSFASVWIHRRTNTYDLEPKTEVLFKEEELFALFCQLQVHKHIDKKAFRNAVDNADRLIFLLYQLRDKKIEPTLGDRPEAFAYFKSCIDSLETLVKSAKLQDNSRIQVEVHRLYTKVYEILQSNWQTVLHITQNVSE